MEKNPHTPVNYIGNVGLIVQNSKIIAEKDILAPKKQT